MNMPDFETTGIPAGFFGSMAQLQTKLGCNSQCTVVEMTIEGVTKPQKSIEVQNVLKRG